MLLFKLKAGTINYFTRPLDCSSYEQLQAPHIPTSTSWVKNNAVKRKHIIDINKVCVYVQYISLTLCMCIMLYIYLSLGTFLKLIQFTETPKEIFSCQTIDTPFRCPKPDVISNELICWIIGHCFPRGQ